MDAQTVLQRATEAHLRLVRFLACDNGGIIRGKATHVNGLARRMQRGYRPDSRHPGLRERRCPGRRRGAGTSRGVSSGARSQHLCRAPLRPQQRHDAL